MKKHYLGIDIGGTQIKWSVIDSHGHLLEKQQIATEASGNSAETWRSKITNIILTKSKEYADRIRHPLSIGISAPGLVSADNRMICSMPERLQGIENFNWSTELDKNIVVINDGHAACLAEYEMEYVSKGVKHFLMLTLGTGVGGGIIIDSKLYQGNLQRAGHVGHMTLDSNGEPTMTNMPGSLEYWVGNFSVAERTGGRYQSVHELVDAYKLGDKLAGELWLESVKKLAVSLASLNNILSPEIIVLGGGITSGAGKSLLKPLKRFMDEYEWRPDGYQTPIKEAVLGSYAGAIGAALFAKKSD